MDMPKAKTPEERTTKKYKTPDDFLAGPRGPPPDDDPTLYMDENGVDVRTLHEDWDHSTGWWVKPWDTVMREVKRINALEKRRAIFVIRSGEREDYKWFGSGKNWVGEAGNARPWDPPMTREGNLQAFSSGKEIPKICEEFILEPVTKIVASPLLRCVECGCGIGDALAVTSARGSGWSKWGAYITHVGLEPGLAMRMDEPWYRSWCVPGANGKTGGPANCPMGTPVAPDDVHAAAKEPAFHLHATRKQAQGLRDKYTIALQVGKAMQVDLKYESVLEDDVAFDYKWGAFESKEAYVDRTLAVLDAAYDDLAEDCDNGMSTGDGSVCLCVHGSAAEGLYERLAGEPSPPAKYGAIYTYVKDDKGKWTCLTVARNEHAACQYKATADGPGPDDEPGYFPNSTHPIDAPLEHPNPELPKIPDPPKHTHFSAGFCRPPKGWVEPPEPPKAPAEPEVDAVE